LTVAGGRVYGLGTAHRAPRSPHHERTTSDTSRP
jgi:hypothetical protein